MVGNLAVAVAASNDHKSNLKKKNQVRWSVDHFAFGRRALWGYIPMQKMFGGKFNKVNNCSFILDHTTIASKKLRKCGKIFILIIGLKIAIWFALKSSCTIFLEIYRDHTFNHWTK
jgi:hypothetical protein